MPRTTSPPAALLRLGRQTGQALIYGIFVLIGGMAALFFVFNTGQLSAEKTKLVNTADAVAYSAGVMHARALNFDAYTNRAMMANETMIAQMVSISSWLQYSQSHADDVPPLDCYTIYSVPVLLGLVEYAPLCYALSWEVGALVVEAANQGFSAVGPLVVAAGEVAKVEMQLAQTAMYLSFLPARTRLTKEVADANYTGDGAVKVDPIPLTDNYTLFDGKPFITPRTGDDRTRFRDTELAAAQKDEFVRDRSWSSHTPLPCSFTPRGDAVRTGSTTLNGFDEWKADDEANLRIEKLKLKLTGLHCETITSYPLGSGSQSASTSGSSWHYSGVPNFYEISDSALGYTPENPDPAKRDPRLQFAIRLTRANTETRTSAGRSDIKPAGQFNLYQGKPAGDVMAAVATSEVYFERFEARDHGVQELASLFNPFWQVRLITNTPAVLAAAAALQVGASP